MASYRSRRWKSGSVPPSSWASSQVSECTPSRGFQWNLTRVVLARGVDEPEGVHAEALHRAGTSAGSPRSDMFQMVWCCASVCSETKSQKVSCARLGLRDLAVGVRLDGVDDVGELDAVLDEEDRDVVADEVEVALARCRTSSRSRGCRAPCRPSRASPATVENRTNTGVSTSFSRNAGRREVGRACRRPTKTPCAPAPRACTTRSGMRSWSKWVIFSRRWWSCSSVGPREPGAQRVVGVAQARAGRGREVDALLTHRGGLRVRGRRRWGRPCSGDCCSGLGGRRLVRVGRLLQGGRLCGGRAGGRGVTWFWGERLMLRPYPVVRLGIRFGGVWSAGTRVSLGVTPHKEP